MSALKNRLLYVYLKFPKLIIRWTLIMSYPFVNDLSQVKWSMAWKFRLIFDRGEQYKHSYTSCLINKIMVWSVKRKQRFTNHTEVCVNDSIQKHV